MLVPGYAQSPERTEKLAFSVAYMNWTVAFLVKDHRKDEFSSWEAIRELGDLRIGLPTRSKYYFSFAQELLPQANLVHLESPRPFLKGSMRTILTRCFSGQRPVQLGLSCILNLPLRSRCRTRYKSYLLCAAPKG